MQPKTNDDSIKITLGKKDIVYLAIIFVVAFVALSVIIYVPRYYKLKYLAASNVQTNNTTIGSQSYDNADISLDTNCLPGVDCYISQTIVLLCSIDDYYSCYASMLNSQNMLLEDYTKSTNFESANLLAQEVYCFIVENNISSRQEIGNASDDPSVADDFFYKFERFINCLDSL